MYLLDTNVISELRRPDKANRGVVAWANATPETEFFISAISILEIEIGVLRMERRDATQAKVLRSWIDRQVLVRFEGRILAIDADIARRCARLHIPDPRSERDALIAATALVHGLSIVSRNVADFEPTGVALINPWGVR